MKAYPYTDVTKEPADGVPGVSMRWAIGKNVDAPNFVTRVVEVEPGSATPHHTHPWEHEVFVLDGKGVVKGVDGDVEVGPRDCVFVPPNEMHQFVNAGNMVLRFLCIIPFEPWHKED